MKQIKELLVLSHTHTDIGYTHPQPVLWELGNRFIDDALDLCEATQDWPEESKMRWTCEVTAPLLYWLEQARASQIKRFKKFVATKQMSAGALYCNITPLVSGAQLAGLLDPIRRLRDELGLPMKVAINHDVNGLPWPVTQLLEDAGVELLLMGINVHMGGFPLSRPLAFRWKGADGRSLLTFSGEHYQAFDRLLNLKERSTDAMAKGLDAYWSRIAPGGYPYDFLYLSATHSYYPDNNPPSQATAELIRKWNAEGRNPVIRYVTPEMLLERINRQAPSLLPDYEGDWPDFWNFGCASSARETRVNRETTARLLASEKLLARRGKISSRERSLRSRAWFNVNLYDEHTWGSSVSTLNPDRDGVEEQWVHKAAYAWMGRSLGSVVMRDALETITGNREQTSGIKSILFFNPGPAPVTVCPRVPAEWLEGKWEHFSSTVQALDATVDALKDGEGKRMGPLEIPAQGFRVIPVSKLKALPVEELCRTGTGFIESPFFRLEFDPGTGRIQSLRNLKTQREVADTKGQWPFFSFVTESVDPERHACDTSQAQGGRDAFFDFDWNLVHAGRSGWQPQWPARRIEAGELRGLRVECDHESASLVLQWNDGSSYENLEQRVRLWAHRPSVEFSASFRKLDVRTTDAHYLVFPLLLEAWEGWYDTADLPVQVDAEQLPGACRDYVTVGSYAAMADANQAVTLACPDAPMIQFGDFHFGRKLQSIPRNPRPLLLAWLTNNYWNTNFRASQPGTVRFRFELSVEDRFDPVKAAVAGASAMSQIEIHPVVPRRDRTETCVSIEGRGLLVLQAKLNDAGDEVLVRVVNVLKEPASGMLSLRVPIISAAFATTLGEIREPLPVKDGKVIFDLPGRRLTTLILKRG